MDNMHMQKDLLERYTTNIKLQKERYITKGLFIFLK